MSTTKDPQTDPSDINSGTEENTTPEGNVASQDAEVAEISTDETLKTNLEPAQADLEQALVEAEQKAAEHHDAWMRAKADAENIRKRAQTDVSNAHKFGIEKFSTELLTVMDSLEAALTVENATVENYKEGMELTHKQLANVFEKFSIKIINPQGEKFDPHLHQAICTVDSELAPNTVVQVMQTGYQLHDRVIRPALVSVSKSETT